MNPALLICALLLSTAAVAAPPKTHFEDHSTQSLISSDDAKKLMAENIPAKVWKVYPAAKYSMLSQVEGGMTANGTCVVTARVMQLTRTQAVRAVLFRPQSTATAFDAIASATLEQCRALARTKLKEATEAVVSDLVKR